MFSFFSFSFAPFLCSLHVWFIKQWDQIVFFKKRYDDWIDWICWICLKKKVIVVDIKPNYIEEQYKKFKDEFEINNQKNDNIENELYDLTFYKTLMNAAENIIENKWKSRVLIEYTPVGNIIMYYDIFRGGFVFFSDNASSVNYNLLNAVAMKYVKTFRCFDFFMDENFDFLKPSPLIKIFYHDDDKTKKISSKFQLQKNDKDIFIASAEKKKKTFLKETSKEISKQINKFIKGGKINEFSFLKKNKPELKLFSYSDFKLLSTLSTTISPTISPQC
jgi:hypothetical protein